jgi:hypothetical protein
MAQSNGPHPRRANGDMGKPRRGCGRRLAGSRPATCGRCSIVRSRVAEADFGRATGSIPGSANNGLVQRNKTTSLFNHLAGEREQRRWHSQAELLRDQVDDELEFGRLLYGQIRGPIAAKDTIDIGRGASPDIDGVGAVRHQPTGTGETTASEAGGEPPLRQSGLGDTT